MIFSCLQPQLILNSYPSFIAFKFQQGNRIEKWQKKIFLIKDTLGLGSLEMTNQNDLVIYDIMLSLRIYFDALEKVQDLFVSIS